MENPFDQLKTTLFARKGDEILPPISVCHAPPEHIVPGWHSL